MTTPLGLNRSLSDLQPDFKDRMQALLIMAGQKGFKLQVNETLRSFARSNQLYAQGRSRPGQIVTNAAAGQSYHNYGVACDLYPITSTGRVEVNFDRVPELMTQMLRVAQVAKTLGIEWGGNWKFRDLPHFQDAHAPAITELKRLYPAGWIPGKSTPLAKPKAKP